MSNLLILGPLIFFGGLLIIFLLWFFLFVSGGELTKVLLIWKVKKLSDFLDPLEHMVIFGQVPTQGGPKPVAEVNALVWLNAAPKHKGRRGSKIVLEVSGSDRGRNLRVVIADPKIRSILRPGEVLWIRFDVSPWPRVWGRTLFLKKAVINAC